MTIEGEETASQNGNDSSKNGNCAEKHFVNGNSSPKGDDASKIGRRKSSTLRNPHIEDMCEDILYHLALSTTSHDLEDMFGDVKFVCVGGTAKRMFDFAKHICRELQIELPPGEELKDICEGSQRYHMYKAGPVLCVSHGIGSPSISVMLHEVIKLLHHADATDVTFLRMGTCGGVGLEPGTIAITSAAVDGMLRPFQELTILGRIVQRPSVLDEKLVSELQQIGNQHLPDSTVVVGKTMCADDFYEGQARLDGAFCEFTQEEKMEFMYHLKEQGVVNIEMESLAFGAICAHARIKAGVICAVIVNRFIEDQVKASRKALEEWQQQVLQMIAIFIKERISTFKQY